MDKQDIIDGLDVILGRRGEKITQGDILIVEAAIMALARASRPEAAPTWHLVRSAVLPSGSPVSPGTTLYAFYGAPEGAHWEYALPDVPTPQHGEGK